MKSKVEDVTLKEELHSIVSAGKTRRKQQAELVQIALKKEEEKKRLDRENYRISTVPVTGQAAHEPSFYHVAGDEHDEGERQAGPASSRAIGVQTDERSRRARAGRGPTARSGDSALRAAAVGVSVARRCWSLIHFGAYFRIHEACALLVATKMRLDQIVFVF